MKSKTVNILLWLLLLPAIIISVWISFFILHLILYFTFRNWIYPYPELPERLLSPIVSSFTMVYVSYKIAPVGKLPIVMLTGILAIIITFMFAVISWSGGTFFGNKLILRFHGGEVLLTIVGVVIAVFVTFTNHALKENDKT